MAEYPAGQSQSDLEKKTTCFRTSAARTSCVLSCIVLDGSMLLHQPSQRKQRPRGSSSSRFKDARMHPTPCSRTYVHGDTAETTRRGKFSFFFIFSSHSHELLMLAMTARLPMCTHAPREWGALWESYTETPYWYSRVTLVPTVISFCSYLTYIVD